MTDGLFTAESMAELLTAFKTQFPMAVWAVSYTHLDVYTRQVPHEPNVKTGWLARYASLVSSAKDGAGMKV